MASEYAGITPYQYAFNNPVMFNDPSGLSPNKSGQEMIDWAMGQLDGYNRTQYNGSVAGTGGDLGYVEMGGAPKGGYEDEAAMGQSGKPNDIIYKDKNGKTLLYIFDGKDEKKEFIVDVEASKYQKTKVISYEKYKGLQERNIDAYGFGIELSGTVGAGANLGVEVVIFNKGDYKDQSQIYWKIGVNIGLEASIGGYYFEATFDGADKDITPASWLGGFNGYSIGYGPAGLSYFWGNGDGTPEIEPRIRDSKTGIRSEVTWHGQAFSLGVGPSGIDIGVKWSFSYYSYFTPGIKPRYLGRDIHTRFNPHFNKKGKQIGGVTTTSSPMKNGMRSISKTTKR